MYDLFRKVGGLLANGIIDSTGGRGIFDTVIKIGESVAGGIDNTSGLIKSISRAIDRIGNLTSKNRDNLKRRGRYLEHKKINK